MKILIFFIATLLISFCNAMDPAERKSNQIIALVQQGKTLQATQEIVATGKNYAWQELVFEHLNKKLPTIKAPVFSLSDVLGGVIGCMSVLYLIGDYYYDDDCNTSLDRVMAIGNVANFARIIKKTQDRYCKFLTAKEKVLTEVQKMSAEKKD